METKYWFLITIISFILDVESKVPFKLTGITCETSYKTVPEKPVCFIKTLQREYYVNIRFNTTRKLPNLKLDFEILHANADGFRKIIEFKQINLCNHHVSTNSESSPLRNVVKMVLDHIAISMNSNVLSACDSFGEFYVKNFTWTNKKIVGFFPSGDYKANLKFYDDLDVEGAFVTISVRKL
jgi:hypothetical protein